MRRLLHEVPGCQPCWASVRVELEELRRLTAEHLAHEEAECIPLVLTALDEEYMGPFMGRRQAESDPTKFFPWLLDGLPAAEAAALVGPLPHPVRGLIASAQPARQQLVDALPS